MLADGRADEAVGLYRGDLLEGFALRDSADFDHWQTAEGQSLRRELGTGLERVATEEAEAGRLEPAIEHARRRLELDPLAESGHRLLMLLYAWAGERAAAIEQYRTCVRTLHRELGVAPLAETTELYEQISAGSLPRPAVRAPVPPGRPGRRRYRFRSWAGARSWRASSPRGRAPRPTGGCS